MSGAPAYSIDGHPVFGRAPTPAAAVRRLSDTTLAYSTLRDDLHALKPGESLRGRLITSDPQREHVVTVTRNW